MGERRFQPRSRPLLAGGAFLLVVAVWSTWVTCGFGGCPDPELLRAYQAGGAPVLLDRHGNELARIHPLETRIVVLDSLPEHVPHAFVAVEDRRFFRHDGVDWVRVVGATVRNLSARSVREGASTITMQLARTLFPERIPGRERTVRRKLLEVRVAGLIERRFQKPEILELYLNHVYVGAGAYGVEAGATYYFDRPAAELSVDEAALLAAIVQAPARLDPRRQPEAARSRRDLVLSRMEREGLLGSAEAESARARPLTVAPEPPERQAAPAPYFVDAVRRLLEDRFGENLYRTPVRVHTTLDLAYQTAAEEELGRQLTEIESGRYGAVEEAATAPADPDGAEASADLLQGALVFLDAGSGDVLAMVGGRDFRTSRYNRATRAHRQVGSAFKPFVYAAALSQGYVASQLLDDAPVTVVQTGSAPWSPRNYDGRFRGPVNMRRAVTESLNVPTVRLALAVGMDEVARIAIGAGMPAPIAETPAMALGTATASPLELAEAYTSLAAGGARWRHRFVTRIEAPTGEILHETQPAFAPAIEPRVAHIVTDMLRDVVDRGTGYPVRETGFSGPAAGKTGTTQEGHDAWFVGYTPEVVGAVWIGFDRPRPIVRGVTGGTLAAPVWGRIMARTHEDREPTPAWAAPPGVVERAVDPRTGMLIEEGCSGATRDVRYELFLEEVVPASTCPPIDGLGDRIAAFFRGLGRGLSGDEEEESEAGERPADYLDGSATADRLLGAERLPVAGGGPAGSPE